MYLNNKYKLTKDYVINNYVLMDNKYLLHEYECKIEYPDKYSFTIDSRSKLFECEEDGTLLNVKVEENYSNIPNCICY